MPSDADKAWQEMLGGKPGAAPGPVNQPVPPATAPVPAPATPPIAAAAKWGAIAVLGIVAIIAIAWVILSNRTRPTIATAPRAPASAQPAAETPAPSPTGSLLDLNSATAAQLEHLPGIGPALAARIVADRSKHGRFTSVDQLDRVEGIGPKTLDKLRPYLMVK